MLDHNEPLVTASSSANNIKPILNKLDPSRFATAISGLPNRKAAIVVANSGNEVLILDKKRTRAWFHYPAYFSHSLLRLEFLLNWLLYYLYDKQCMQL